MADTERDLTVETAEAAPIDAAKGAEIMEKFEKESRTRNFSFQPLVKAGYVLCLLFTVYHLIFASGMVSTQNIKHHAVHVGMVLVLGFLFYPAFKKSSRKKVAWYDWICIALSVAMPCYVFYRYMAWTSTGFRPTTLDIIMGTLLILLVMECSRRISGPALTILSAIFLIYGMYGRYFPGIFQHRGYTWTRMVQYLTCDISGIYGSSVKVSATFIVLFIIFGEVMNKCGMGQFFNDIANSLAGHTKGGPAKVAVLASGFLGSINGSAVANVVTTGTFTIPLMKKTGYESETAAAVEAAASTGGQFTPPVMGATAFLIAERLAVPYFDLVKAAAIPAILYYASLLLSVDIYAQKNGLQGIKKEDVPKIRPLLRRFYLLLPLVFLVYILAVTGKTVARAGLYTILLTLVIVMLDKKCRLTPEKLVKICVNAAKSAVPVAVACAMAGIISGVVMGTGVGYRLSSALIDVSGGQPLILLVLTMLVSLIMGMGIPTISAYLVLAILVAPALTQMGFSGLASHLFIFYFGCISVITPPVALASYAGAGIAGCSPTKAGTRAFRLAICAFILPYLFVYNESLLWQGAWYNILWSALSALVALRSRRVFRQLEEI